MSLILPNDIINDTPADAVPVDTNYKAIAQYVNTNLIDRDGSVAMTGQLTLVGGPIQDNHAVRKAYVDAILPVGVMLPWLGIAAPAGQWALANGATLQNTEYPVLYNLIGQRYGGTAGSFMLPNMAGVVPVGQKESDVRYGTVGNYGGTTKVPVPSHVHGMGHNHPSTVTGPESGHHQHSIAHNHGAKQTTSDGAHTHTGFKSDTFAAGTGAGLTAGGAAVGAITASGGAHDHTLDLGAYAGNSGNEIGNHTHALDIPNFVGNTGAFSLEVADPDTRKSTTDFYAPFVVINYIVRIA